MFIKGFENWLNTFEIVVIKSFELLNSCEQINQLGNSSTEEIKLSENLIW